MFCKHLLNKYEFMLEQVLSTCLSPTCSSLLINECRSSGQVHEACGRSKPRKASLDAPHVGIEGTENSRATELS